MNADEDKCFLVFSGGNDRAVLGFLRALRQCGKRALIVARTQDDRILKTSFRKDVKWIRSSHELSMEVFTQCLQGVREAVGQCPLAMLPSTEYFNTFLLRHRTEIETMGCEIPLVDAAVYDLLTSKRSSTELFAAAGFSVPHELNGSMAIKPPLVAKPLNNISREGQSLYPKMLRTRSELNEFQADPSAVEYFLQEYVQGESIYLLLYLPRSGGEELVWSQRNLMQQPNGKSMLFAEPSNFHHSPAAKHVINVLRQSQFWGLGMVEVIQTTDRQVFIEVNPRIWGPVQLCIDHQQPLLHAFIGEALHNDSKRYTLPKPGTRSLKKKYFWLAGLADTLAAGDRPVWHMSSWSIPKLIFTAMGNDVYLRMDSWRCFLRDLKRALKRALQRERTEN